MQDIVKTYSRPRLNSPIMIAAWPGIADVAMIAAVQLIRTLKFKELAEIRAPYFFDPVGVITNNGIVQEPQFPQSNFYYWKNKKPREDIILFIGEAQPPSGSYDLANIVLDVGLKYHISRLYTFAAALTRIHHTEEPKVWGVGTNEQMVEELKQHNLFREGNAQIGGLNGLLLGVAKEKNIDGICLLGEIPAYASRMSNPIAALAIIRTLKDLLNLKIDTSELEEIAAETKKRMKEIAAETMGQYINYFTEPIWESDEGEDNEEYDENE